MAHILAGVGRFYGDVNERKQRQTQNKTGKEKKMDLNNVTHKEFEQDYINGREAALQDIREMGWEAARDKFNIDYPPGEHIFCSLSAYYFTKGRIDALVDKM